MRTMIERVARGIAANRGLNPDLPAYRGPPWSLDNGAYVPLGPPCLAWQLFERDAVAAIQAMEDPTEDMVGAAEAAHGLLEGFRAEDGWRTMVHAALKAKP